MGRWLLVDIGGSLCSCGLAAHALLSCRRLSSQLTAASCSADLGLRPTYCSKPRKPKSIAVQGRVLDCLGLLLNLAQLGGHSFHLLVSRRSEILVRLQRVHSSLRVCKRLGRQRRVPHSSSGAPKGGNQPCPQGRQRDCLNPNLNRSTLPTEGRGRGVHDHVCMYCTVQRGQIIENKP